MTLSQYSVVRSGNCPSLFLLLAKTTDINIYTVQPLYFLRDFVANSSYTTQSNQTSLNYTTLQNYSIPAPDPNAPFLNYPELQYNSSVNFSTLGLPDLYYFGISGKKFNLPGCQNTIVFSCCWAMWKCC